MVLSCCCRLAGVFCILTLCCVSLAAVTDPAARFEEATRFDLEGKTQLAFAGFMNAANAGLPQAEFNVAVMLDSGRGVNQDLTQAATWYARAASHGLSRAAYNLGQLYETGQGVPLNTELAYAWFEASRLPASIEHLKRKKLKLVGSKLTAPELVSPVGDSRNLIIKEGVELVWTSKEQPGPAQFYVELLSLDGTGLHPVFFTTTRLSSLFVSLPNSKKDYIWRVSALSKESSQYAISYWSGFRHE